MPFRWTRPASARHYVRVSSFLVFLALWLAGAPGWAATIDRVDVTDGRIVVHFDSAVADASSFVLDGPRRIALDIAGVRPGRQATAGGAVSAIRQGVRHGRDARIVFDLSQPMLVSGGGFEQGGRVLTLDLAGADAASFAQAVDGPAHRFASPAGIADAIAHSRYSVSVPVPAAAPAPALPRIYGAAGRPLVVIDPGHGGHDPGAISADTG